MAVVETIRIEGDTSGIENKIQKLNKTIEGLIDTVEDVGNESKKSFDKMDKEVKESSQTLKKTDSTLKSFVKSIKGAAVAAGAFAIVKGVFQQTQFAIDSVNTAMNTLTGFINNLPTLIKNLGVFGGIGGALKLTIEQGRELVRLEKESLKAEVERQRIQLVAQRDAEVQRQIRDDATRSIEDRIAANQKISKIIEKQIEDETKQIQIQEKAAISRKNLTKKIEDQVAADLKSLQLVELKERTTSNESERLANQNALLSEKVSLQKQINENDAEARRFGITIEREFKKGVELREKEELAEMKYQDTLLDRLKKEKFLSLQSIEIRQDFNEKQIALAKKLRQTDNEAYESLLRERLDLEIEYNETSIQLTNDIFQFRADNIVGGFDLASQSAQAFADLNDALSAGDQANAEEAFKRTKALQLAGAIANTAAAVTAQLAVPQDALTGANFVKAGIALTTGLAQIATIKSTKFEQQATTSPTTTVSAPTQPAQFNIVGQSGTNQLLEGIAGTFDRPVRAYVVSGEVLSGSQLDRQRLRTATFP